MSISTRMAITLLALVGLIGTQGIAHGQGPASQPDTIVVDPERAASAPTDADPEVEGDAETKILASKSLLQAVRDGGPLMAPIGLCSFILMVFIFERSISLRRGRIIPRPFVRRFLEQLKERTLSREKALALCHDNRSPVSEVFEAALHKWNRPSVEVEQAIIDEGERVTSGLRRYLRLINGIATVCPLLGLLGTVLGMIQAFDAIAVTDAGVRPETAIASGISQALLTTAAGLSVAIPALIAYLFFVGRVDRLVVEFGAVGAALGQQLVNLIASDAWRPEADSAVRSGGERGEKSAKRRTRAA